MLEPARVRNLKTNLKASKEKFCYTTAGNFMLSTFLTFTIDEAARSVNIFRLSNTHQDSGKFLHE
jgi:hypothetical protein